MEAVGFWPRGIERCGRRRSGSVRPTRSIILLNDTGRDDKPISRRDVSALGGLAEHSGPPGVPVSKWRESHPNHILLK